MYAKWKTVKEVANESGCTNLSSVASVSNHLWAMKVASSNETAVLYYYSTFTSTSSPKKIKLNDVVGHGNGMTCSTDYLWIACSHKPYILKIPTSFMTSKMSTNSMPSISLSDLSSYKISTDLDFIGSNGVSAIARYATNRIIIRVSGVGIKKNDTLNRLYDQFKIVKYTPSTNSLSLESVFNVIIPSAVSSVKNVQDVFYHIPSGIFYCVYKLSDTKTDIFTYDLDGDYTDWNGIKSYERITTLTIDNEHGASGEPSFSTFEGESACAGNDGKLLVPFNTQSGINDRILKITNYDL